MLQGTIVQMLAAMPASNAWAETPDEILVVLVLVKLDVMQHPRDPTHKLSQHVETAVT